MDAMILNPRLSLPAFCLMLLTMLGARPGLAQEIAGPPQTPAAPSMAPQTNQQNLSEKPHYTFDKTDFLKPSIGNVRGLYYRDQPATFFVGEPVVVPLFVNNHTKYPITLSTNFVPRGNLKISIRPQGERSRNYFGPYPLGQYPAVGYYLYPFEQINKKIILWGDRDTSSGLVFEKPGTYRVQIEMRLEIPEGSIQTAMNFEPFEINILPTPPEFEPLVQKMIQSKGAIELQMHRLPAAWAGDTETLLGENVKPTLFTPYLAFAVANHEYVQYKTNPGDSAAKEKALKYFQVAAFSSSPFKEEAYAGLLSYLKELELSSVAIETAQRMIKETSRDQLGRIGQDKLLQEYLPTVREIDPVRYWSLLE